MASQESPATRELWQIFVASFKISVRNRIQCSPNAAAGTFSFWKLTYNIYCTDFNWPFSAMA